MNQRITHYLTVLIVTFSAVAGLISCGGGGGGGSATSGTEDHASNTTSSGADRLYVSTTGDDGNDGRSESSAFRTLSQAANAAASGDTVFLRGGSYEGTVLLNRSGREGAPITYTSFPGELAELNGSDVDGKDTLIVAGDWIVVRGISITNGGRKGILIVGNNNVIDGVVSHGNHGGPGIEVFEGENNLIIHSTAHSNEDRDSGGEDGDGIHITGNSNHVRACTMYGNSDDGFDAWDSVNTVVDYSVSYGNGNGSRGDGNGFKLSNFSSGQSIAQYNVSFNNARRGFTTNGGGGHMVINNTAFNNTVNFQHASSRPANFTNNLSIAGDLDFNSATDQVANSWNQGIRDAGVLSRDPASPDFLSLSPQSPAIDIGVDVGGSQTGAAPDLGALELGGRISDLLAAGFP